MMKHDDLVPVNDVPRILLERYGNPGPLNRQLILMAVNAALPELQKRGRFWFCHRDDLPKLAERVGVIQKIEAA